MSTEVFSSEEEFDVSEASSIPQLEGAVLTITDFSVVEKDEDRTLHQLTFETEGMPFPITKGYWFKHPNEKAQSIGRAELKKIALAATGSARYTSTSLVGTQIVGNVNEDANGFPQVKRVKKVTN
jgi:hypothetical protein